MSIRLETVDEIRNCSVVPSLAAKYAELKRRVHLDITLLAAVCTRLAKLGFKLEEDGEIIARLKMVDEGKMSPSSYFKLLPVPRAASLIGKMSVHAQDEIANGAPVPVAVLGKNNEPVIIRKAIFDMSAQEKATAFVDGAPRQPAEMRRIVKLRAMEKEIPPYRVTADGRLIVHKAGDYDLDAIIKEYAAKKKGAKGRRLAIA